MVDLKVQIINCPNCGKKIEGIMDEKGGVRLSCNRCGVLVYSKLITPRRIRLDVTLPVTN